MLISKGLVLKEVNFDFEESIVNTWFTVKLHNEWTLIFKEFEIENNKIVRNEVFKHFCRILRVPQKKLEEIILNF